MSGKRGSAGDERRSKRLCRADTMEPPPDEQATQEAEGEEEGFFPDLGEAPVRATETG